MIETGVGNCHVYVDRAADLDKALAIVVNAKTHRTSVCNAAESLLVHADVADAFLPRVVAALQDAGVTIHGDAAFTAYDGVVAATDEDYAAEYLSLDISARVVPDLDDAIDAHPAVLQPAHRRDRHRGPGRRPPLHRRRRLRRRAGQRLHPVHRRRRVRLRRRDRHQHPEAARPRPDGPARDDLDQVRRHRRRPRALADPGRLSRHVADAVVAAEAHEEVNETLNWAVGGCALGILLLLMLALVVFGGGREHS